MNNLRSFAIEIDKDLQRKFKETNNKKFRGE